MEASPLISVGLPIALFIIMVGMGMTLTVGDFRRVVASPTAMAFGTIAQIVLMPLLAFALIWGLSLPPAISVGLVIAAACPGGTTSNLFTFLGRGNVALSIVLTVLATLITIVTLPLYTNLALDMYMNADERISLPVLQTMGMLAALVLLPVVIGMIVRVRSPELAARAESAVSVFGGLVLAALVVALIIGARDQLGELLQQAGPAAVALNIGGILIGLICGRMVRLSHGDSLTVAVELGIKNSTVGLLVALTMLDSSVIAMPVAVYGTAMFLFGFALAVYGRRLNPVEAPASSSPERSAAV